MNMNKVRHLLLPLFLTIVSPLTFAVDPVKPTAPFVNPYLAASTYAVTHASSDFTPTAGPVGPGRRLKANEVQWKPVGPVNAWAVNYSGPYPNGKRVMWVGGYDRVEKLDADTLEVLTTYGIGGKTYFGEEEINRHLAIMDKLDGKTFVDYNLKLWEEPFRDMVSFYRLLSRDNELYLPHHSQDGSISLRVYGEADATDPASKILLKREWTIPPEISKSFPFGINMTADGWIVMVLADGTLIALSRDLTKHYFIKLPNAHPEKANQDVFNTFVRNGVTTDDQGGVYVVTRDNMHRVQWTGTGLSMDEADGAWSAPYPNELGNGSGTTPGLMGWGPKEDHLAVIADGTSGNNAVVFWRDKIPDDWKGLPGLDRRIAGITPIHFVSNTDKARIENGPVIHGYDVFFNNTYPVKHLPDQGSPAKQFLAEVGSMNIPGHEGLGGAKISWDPKARLLKTAWQSQANFVSAVCTISGATEILYCWGARNREWALEGVDWKTGKSAFHYALGRSQRFNAMGGPIIVAPNGAIDCACAGGLGMARVKPERR